MVSSSKYRCKSLVLDAGPLLSLSPLRGLAETFYTVPQVLEELKDKNAQQHLQQLGLKYGVKIELKSPSPASLAAAISWSKKTGDYSVLSHPDICVIALTHMLHEEAKGLSADKPIQVVDHTAETTTNQLAEELSKNLTFDASADPLQKKGEQENEPLNVELERIGDEPSQPAPVPPTATSESLYDDPSDSDDGEGEWITPGNVSVHKSREIGFLPKGELEKEEIVDVGCMTADFAMQNTLLQMGLNLVSSEGKRIQKVKNWVLRCHACFKICKDPSKKFCPSCGNSSLIRTSVSVAAPGVSEDTPALEVHLKPNFQYRIRGTKYSIPAPKPGSAKTGPGEGLILREDQPEYMRAKQRADTKKQRDEAKMMKGVLARGAAGADTVAIGSWMDPDWVPEMLVAGTGGKGRTVHRDGDMPTIGYGRKNPNERRRKK